jgi:hypothetical protein
MQTTLERAADVLADPQAASCDVEALLKEMQIEAAHAEKALVQAKEDALDPVPTPSARCRRFS